MKDIKQKEYRAMQFDKIKETYMEYKTKIKFIKPCGETNWLDIEENEFAKIMKILTS